MRSKGWDLPEAEAIFREAWRRCEQPPITSTQLPWHEAVDTILHDVYRRYDGDAEPGRTRWRVRTRPELAGYPPTEYRIDHVTSRPSGVIVVGEPGVGKTTAVASMAGSVATGRRWLGHDVEPCPVLWVAGEGPNGLNARFSAWEKRYNDGEPIPDDRLRFVVKPDSLLGAEEWDRLSAEVVEMRAGFVVLDTMSTLFPDADETKDAAKVVRRMSDLADATGATVVLVHHTGWSDKTRVRGGSQFEANADEVLVLNHVSQGSPIVKMLSKKVRDGEAGQQLWLQRTPYAGSVVIEAGRAEDGEVPLRDRINALLAMASPTPMTAPQLLTELGDVPRFTFYRQLNALAASGDAKEKAHGNARGYVAGGSW